MFNIIFYSMVVLAQNQVEALIHAQNVDDFVEIEKKWQVEQELGANCRVEVQQGSFPYYCLEFNEQLLANPQVSKDFIEKINQLCIQKSSSVVDKAVLNRILNSSYQNEVCLQSLSQRLKDLEYMRN